MAVTIPQLAARLRLGDGQTAPPDPIAGMLAEYLVVAEDLIAVYAPLAPEAVRDAAAVRITGYLYDTPPQGGRQMIGNAMFASGAASLLDLYRSPRGTVVSRQDETAGTPAPAPTQGFTPAELAALDQLLAAGIGRHDQAPDSHRQEFERERQQTESELGQAVRDHNAGAASHDDIRQAVDNLRVQEHADLLNYYTKRDADALLDAKADAAALAAETRSRAAADQRLAGDLARINFPVRIQFYPQVFDTNAALEGNHAILIDQIRDDQFTRFQGPDEINRLQIIERNTSTVVHDQAWQFSGNDWLIDFNISAGEANNIALTGGDEFVEFRVVFANRAGHQLFSDYVAIPVGDERPFPATRGDVETVQGNVSRVEQAVVDNGNAIRALQQQDAALVTAVQANADRLDVLGAVEYALLNSWTSAQLLVSLRGELPDTDRLRLVIGGYQAYQGAYDGSARTFYVASALTDSNKDDVRVNAAGGVVNTSLEVRHGGQLQRNLRFDVPVGT